MTNIGAGTVNGLIVDGAGPILAVNKDEAIAATFNLFSGMIDLWLIEEHNGNCRHIVSSLPRSSAKDLYRLSMEAREMIDRQVDRLYASQEA